MPRLILVRHGQSQWNLENRFTGWWDVDLTELGETEARAAGTLLKDKGIRCELDMWGHDIPHDWPSWRRQLTHHLPRFC